MKPFLDHLEDLRWTLVRCALALAAGFLVALPLAPTLLTLLATAPEHGHRSAGPFSPVPGSGRSFFGEPAPGGVGGLLLSSPLLRFSSGALFFPGLFDNEKRVAMKAIGFALLLFVLGVSLCYVYALPVALKMMFNVHDWMGVRAEWTITSYIAFATPFLIGFGLIFELPVILVALGRLGFLTAAQLRARRRHAIVAALVIGMVMTPPDVFSQVLMAAPLIGLYEISIWLVAMAERRARALPR